MSNRQTQEQRQEQSLTLTPQQLQVVKMLELTGLELEARIERELEENPALEEGQDTEASDESTDDLSLGDDLSGNEQDWELGEYASEDDMPAYKLRELQDRNARREEIPFAASAPSLDESLYEQLAMEGLAPDDEEVARYIIGNLSSEGYLQRTPEELQDDLLFKADQDVSLDRINALIERLRKLEPAGIGARDLQDCLLLQLQRKEQTPQIQLAQRMLQTQYEAFTAKQFDRLTSSLKIDRDQLAELYTLISKLNPKPGDYSTDDEARMLQYNPDFLVTLEDGELLISLLGERDLRPLRISPLYNDMLHEAQRSGNNRRERDTRDFIKHKIAQARSFIDAVAQRQDTLRRTMYAIVAHQRAFFLSGHIEDLRPMILKDIAERTGLDLSTISRVSNSKSVQTDYGVYPLKFFFNEGLSVEDGEDINTKVIKQALALLIAEEDKQKPLTDEALTSLLAEQGYPLARRTVAKYREQLRLPVARLRKSL